MHSQFGEFVLLLWMGKGSLGVADSRHAMCDDTDTMGSRSVHVCAGALGAFPSANCQSLLLAAHSSTQSFSPENGHRGLRGTILP